MEMAPAGHIPTIAVFCFLVLVLVFVVVIVVLNPHTTKPKSISLDHVCDGHHAGAIFLMGKKKKVWLFNVA